MRRLVLGLLFLCAVAVEAPRAQEGHFQRLDIAATARHWQAVGRLELAGRGFCTGTLVAPDLVVTAAHCLYDRETGMRLDPGRIAFRAGLRDGRAVAEARVARAVAHPDYVFDAGASALRVRHDVALLELARGIDMPGGQIFATGAAPRAGDRIGVVSYARGRAEAPSLQNACRVLARQEGMLVMSCDVDFGASGAPVFTLGHGGPRIVSVISAMAEVEGRKVSLGMPLAGPLRMLRAAIEAGPGMVARPVLRRVTGAAQTRP
ncbi:trypsin-like serine peptidase [Roseovarius sp. D22-M7]|uniref:trypsin-like serine peptidase n=1 Tax=Roseovarius sp. D22-M7 TaxID=3127116 RepID=UPI00300FE9BB